MTVVCAFCGGVFTDNESLSKHVTTIHADRAKATGAQK